MAIPFNTYTFHCRFETEAVLPGYLGSTLRGALGWSLKKVSCALKRQECTTCLLRQQCAYAWLFETERYQAGSGQAVNARPHPFVLQPGDPMTGKQPPGTVLEFSLLLLGRANELLPQLTYAVKLMGEAGIGSGRRYGLGRFCLERVVSGGTCCFDRSEQVVHAPRSPGCLQLDRYDDRPIHTISVHLETPLRLKQGNRIQPDLPFHVLIRAALRRVTALEQAYGQGEPDLDYRGLVRRAEQVAAVDPRLRWQEMSRYSNRQRQKVSLSGLGGSIRYKGELAEFLSPLLYAEQVHLGKQTVFGLGKVGVTVQQEALEYG